MKILNRLIGCTCFFLFWCAGKAQVSDSLCKVLPENLRPADCALLTRNELRTLLQQAGSLPRKYLNEIEQLSHILENTMKDSRNIENKIRDAQLLGLLYINLKEYKYSVDASSAGYENKAISFFQQVVNLAGNTLKYQPYVSDAYMNTGIVYFRKDKYDSATIFCNKCIVNCIRQNDSARLFDGYCLRGDIYMVMDSMDKALHSNRLAFALIPHDWGVRFADRYYFQMRCYKVLFEQTGRAQYADSVKWYASNLFQHINEQSYYYYRTYEVLGKLYFSLKDYKKAVQYIDSSLAAQKQNRSNENLVVRYFMRDLCLIKLGHKERINALLDSIPAGSYNNRRLLYEVLYQQAVDEKDWRNAYLYYREYDRCMDSLRMGDVTKLIFESEQKYAVAEKQAQISALENKNLIKEKEQRRFITAAAGITLLLLLCLVIVIGMYRYLRIKRTSEVQLLTAELYNMEAAIHDERLQQQQKIAAQRQKIAEDMHDEVSSGLAAFRFYILDLKARATSPETITILTDLEAEAQVLYQQARDFMKNLNVSRPVSGYNVCELADQLAARFVNEKVLIVNTDIDRNGVLRYFTEAMHHELYLVIKEAVANSTKHAGANVITITITFNDKQCHFSVSDNGKGFRRRKADAGGIGLKSITNRIHSIGGELTIRSDNSGTTIKGYFPV